jgi:hypothetical protein
LPGIGRFTHFVLQVWTAEGNGTQKSILAPADATLALRAACLSSFLSLPGTTPYNPLQPILRMGNLCYIA